MARDHAEVAAAPDHTEREQPANPEEMSRRQFLGRISVAIGALGAVLVGIPFVSFLLAPLINQPPETWINVGDVNSFKLGETVQVAYEDPYSLPYAGVSDKTAAWLRRYLKDGKDTFEVFAVNCTHLGCPVQWVPDGEIFLCPCHGGVYYSDGQVAAGPPPKALPMYRVRLDKGQVQILTQPVPLGG